MFLRNDNGRILAELKFEVGSGKLGTQEFQLDDRASLFRMLKLIPREFLKVDIRYTSVGYDQFIPLTVYRKHQMDIQAALSDSEEMRSQNVDAKPASKMLFVAPANDKSPDDGVLTYSTVEKIFDLSGVPDRTVVLFREDQAPMLKCLCDNTALFDLELRVLTGLPETDYSANFDSAVWSLDKVAYLPFLSELRLATEIENQLAANEMTAYDREKASYTRKSGTVKAHSKFETVVPEGEGAAADDSEVD